MLSSSQARNIAETQWGRGGTTAHRTNRIGAFYFSCASHGGFVIDGRAISDDGKERLRGYAKPELTQEFWTPATGEIHAVLNPFRTRSRSFSVPISARARDVEIWCFEEDCAWCLPAIFDGIALQGETPKDALSTFTRWFNPSNHQRAQAQQSFAQHFPDLQTAA